MSEYLAIEEMLDGEGLSIMEIPDDLLDGSSFSADPPDLQPSEIPEPNRKRTVCDLRKSIAWNFTGEGAFDLDALGIGNRTFRKVGRQLPNIQEEIGSSTELNVTLDGDNLEPECLKYDPGNISITAGCTAGQGELPAASSVLSSKKLVLSSQNKMTPKNSSRRCGLDKDSLGKIFKEDLIHPRRGDQKLSASRTDSLPREPTKRTPVGTKCIKVQNNTGKAFSGAVGNQQSVSVSKNPVPRNSCNIITSACSLKPSSSSFCSVGSMKKSTPDAKSSAKLAARSRTTLSNSSVKSPSNALKRNSERKTTGLSSCEPSVRTPQKIQRNKNGSQKTALSSCSSSISRLSSSISSVSSLDSLPSESSTHSTEAKLSSSECQIISFPSSCCGGVSLASAVPQPLDMQLLPRKQSYIKHEKPGTQLRKCTDEASRSTRVPSQPAFVDSRRCNNKDSGEHFKPSRLRMPTPKFGFFDTGSSNNISRHPENYVQNSSPNSLSGINQHIGTGRCKVSELQPTETLAKSVTVTEMKPMSPAVVHQPRMTSLELFEGNDLCSSDTANGELFSDVSVAVFDNPNRHNSEISFNNEEHVISSKTSCSPLSAVMDSDSEQQLSCILQNSGHAQRVLSPGTKSYNKENLFRCENQTGDMHEHVEDPITHKMMIDKLSHLSLCDADNLSKLGKLKLASPTEHLFVCDHKVNFQKGKDSNMNTQINGDSGINVMQENIIGMIIEEEIFSRRQESK